MQFIHVSVNQIIPLSSVTSIEFLPAITVKNLDPEIKNKPITHIVKSHLSRTLSLSYTEEDTGELMLACEYYLFNRHSVIFQEKSSYKGLFKISTENNAYILTYEQVKDFKLDFILDAFK